jgi:hypothetical protein
MTSKQKMALGLTIGFFVVGIFIMYIGLVYGRDIAIEWSKPVHGNFWSTSQEMIIGTMVAIATIGFSLICVAIGFSIVVFARWFTQWSGLKESSEAKESSESLDEVLLKVARLLNRHGIRWGIGGSLVLKRHGLIKQVNDIDIIIAEEDIERAVSYFDRVAKRMNPPLDHSCQSKHFHKYTWKGVKIDVMAGFMIKHAEGAYEFVFDELSVDDVAIVDLVQLPYTSLEDWLIAYMLMPGREEKVDQIEAHLKSTGLAHPELLERGLKQGLPKLYEDRLRELLS